MIYEIHNLETDEKVRRPAGNVSELLRRYYPICEYMFTLKNTHIFETEIGYIGIKQVDK